MPGNYYCQALISKIIIEDTMNIIGINGSRRKNGNSATLVKKALEGASIAQAKVEYLDLSTYHIQECIGCEKCRIAKTCTQFNDGMQLIYPKVINADCIILASPVYNQNMTALMKTFIDRLYPFFNFPEKRPGPYSSRFEGMGKKAIVFAVCEQPRSEMAGFTALAMSHSMKVLGIDVEKEIVFTSHFEASSVSKSPEDLQRAFSVGYDFVKKHQ